MQHGSFRGKSKIYSAIIPLVLWGWAASFADWPQFQGPYRNGSAPESGLARSWGDGGPEELWSIPVGEGFGGPAVRDGEVYILDRVDNEEDVVLCLSLDTGEELWRYSYKAPGEVPYNGSRATPTVTENYVYTVGMMGHFTCVDRRTHRPVWQRKLLDEFLHRKNPKWGFTQSPSLYKDLVVVAPQSRVSTVAAFNRITGELVWASPNLGGVGYASPVIAKLGGVDQAVMVTAPDGQGMGGVTGLSMTDGSVLWTYDGWACRIPIPSPTPLPGDRLFITGEYGAGSAMIRITRDGNRFAAEELFTTQKCGSQIHQPLVYENHLYVNSNGNKRRDGMMCLTFDGQPLWRSRDTNGLPTFDRGSLLLAGDMIISLDGKTGMLHLIEPSTLGYAELARAQIFEGTKMWSPMALSEGKLVLRSQEEMKCLDLGAR